MLDIFEVRPNFKCGEIISNSLNRVTGINLEDFFKIDLAIQELNTSFNIEFSYFQDFLMNAMMIEAFHQILQKSFIDEEERTKWLTLLDTASKNHKWLYFVCD